MQHLIWIAILVFSVGCQSQPGDASPADKGATQPDEPAAASMDTAADTTQLPETNYYEIATPMGRMVIHLYDETPQHRDNFKKLVVQGFYDGTTFHRVIPNFMVQGGDPNSKDDNPRNDGQGGPGYTIPAEFNPNLIHKRGALAAARQGDQVNPQRRSSGSQFYIVQGRTWDAGTLDQIQQRLRQSIPDPNFTFSDEARSIYQTDGGYPPLDMQYTVFGELVEGFDVLDAIGATQTGANDRPVDDVTMTIKPLPDYQPPAGDS